MIIHQRTCAKSCLTEVDLPIIWRRVDAQGASDLHRTNDTGFIASARLWRSSLEDIHRTVDRDRHQRIFIRRWIEIDEEPRSTHDCGSIVARSWHNRGPFCKKWGAMTAPNDGPRSPRDRGHQSAPTTASNGPNFRAKIPFKKPMYPSLFS